MNLGITHIAKVVFLALALSLPLQCQSGEVPLQLSTTHYRLITKLLKTAVVNMDANPVFRVHTMGMDINKEVGVIIGEDVRMRDLRLSGHGLPWGKLPDDAQSKFRELLADAMKPERLRYSIKETDLSMPEVWREALSNSKISATCCGGNCQFQINITTNTPLGYVYLDHYNDKKGKSRCSLSWNIPESMMGELSQVERSDIKHQRYSVTLVDENCDGTLVLNAEYRRRSGKKLISKRLRGPTQEWMIEIKSLYEKLLESFNPVQNGKASEGTPCDI